MCDHDECAPAKPGKWIICRVCSGEGTTVNPNLDANGLDDEWADDPDFMEDYRSGVYDVPCGACGGSGKMREGRMQELADHAADRRLAAMEDGDYEAYQHASDYRYG